jgi:hypothetical protein
LQRLEPSPLLVIERPGRFDALEAGPGGLQALLPGKGGLEADLRLAVTLEDVRDLPPRSRDGDPSPIPRAVRLRNPG